MSSPLRQKRGNTIVFTLLALVILGLGGFGVTNFSGRVISIGTVGDESIEVTDYARALQQEMRATSAQVGQQITIDQAQALGLDRQVQSQLFTAAALDGEAKRIGVSAGDEQVRKSVLGIQQFQGPDGKFSRDTYRMVLKNEGLTEADFEGKVRKDAVRAMMERAVANGTAAPSTYVSTLTSYIGEQRDFILAELLPSDLPQAVAAPDEAAVKAYYDANPDKFTKPEVRRITYVWLSPDKVAPTVEVDEKDLKAAYDARIKEFVVPERRLVERLVFPSAEEAKAAKDKIDAGTATFADAVKARGLTLEDVDLGEKSKEDLGAAGDAVFALTEPGVVGPFDTDLGPALFSMNGILAAQETTYAEAKPDLETEARLDRARRTIADKMQAIEDLLASGASLEDVAKETGMELGSVEFSADATGGITGYEAFRKAAASVTADDFPELAQLDDGGIFALRLDGIDPPKVRPLDEVRSDVVAAWTKDETHKKLIDLGEAIRTDADKGVGLSAKGLVTTSYLGFLRSGHLDAAPAAVVETVFKTDAGKTAVIDADGRVFVAQVVAVHAADPNEADQIKVSDSLSEQARQGLSQDIFSLYAQALEAKAGITIDQAALNAVHSQVR